MAYPTPIVEIAFDDGPYVVNPTWTDVTQYVRSMSIDRGRSDDWGDFNSTAQVVLNNRTRLFDPYYTSGTYYGKLLPRRQIRIRATAGATTYDVFRGFVDGWNPTWTDAGTDSTTTLQCFDALQLLAGEQLPADWSRAYILSQSPRHYYPCDEPIVSYSGTTVLNDYGSIPLPITASVYATNANQLAVGLPGNSIQASYSTAGVSGYGTTTSNTDFSVSMWAVMDSDTATTGGAVGQYGYLVGWNPSTAKYVVTISDGPASLERVFTTTETYDGSVPTHVAFSFNITSKTLVFYVDGTVAPTSVATSGAIIVILGEQCQFGTGQFQQFCVWTGIISQSVVRNIINYSKANFPETTSARFQRIIAETPFSASLTSPATAPANSVLDITDNAPQVTSELRLVAASEGGPLFVSKSGVITMMQQTEIFTASTSIQSQVTYGDGGVDVGTEATLLSDGDSMRNQAFINMSGGGMYEKTNATSISTYGTASMTTDTQVQTLANAEALANVNVGWGSNVYPLLSPVQVVLDANNDWSSTMALELMQRVTVKLKPPTGNVITHPMLVQRIQHEVVPGFWQTTLEGSARWAAVFIINQSLIGGTDLLA